MSAFDEDYESQRHEYQKWDYINLADFTTSSCGNIVSYIWLWFLAIIAVLVLVADSYTAFVLLVFDHWPSQIQPVVPFTIARWIFAICILFSFALLAYEWYRAIKVLKKGSVSKDYLDPLAATLQSMRLGSGQGFRRFLVFAALTKSKKGADYSALFCYFQFKSMVRIIVAEGPRQALNAMTIYSITQADLLKNGSGSNADVGQFFTNVKILAQQQQEHAAILFTMLFTLVIWAFSFLCLIAAIILYVAFLWHYIPSSDGSIAQYCRRKIEKRLQRIVGTKMRDAIEKQDAKRRKQEADAIRRGKPLPPPERRPTLPEFFAHDDDSSSVVSLSRKPTLLASESTVGLITPADDEKLKPLQKAPTLPTLSSSPSRASSITSTNLPRPGFLKRSETESSGMSNSSDWSTSSDRPLLPTVPPQYQQRSRNAVPSRMHDVSLDEYASTGVPPLQDQNQTQWPPSRRPTDTLPGSITRRPVAPQPQPQPTQPRGNPYAPASEPQHNNSFGGRRPSAGLGSSVDANTDHGAYPGVPASTPLQQNNPYAAARVRAPAPAPMQDPPYEMQPPARTMQQQQRPVPRQYPQPQYPGQRQQQPVQRPYAADSMSGPSMQSGQRPGIPPQRPGHTLTGPAAAPPSYGSALGATYGNTQNTGAGIIYSNNGSIVHTVGNNIYGSTRVVYGDKYGNVSTTAWI